MSTSIKDVLHDKIRGFLETRGKPTTDKDIRNTLRTLNDLWWRRAGELIEAQAPEVGGSLQLDAAGRQLLDHGVIDPRLLGQSDSFFATLSTELEIEVTGNIFYLSEWLQVRWELDTALADVEAADDKEATFRDNSAYQNAHNSRMEALKKLQHLVRGLPGTNPTIIDMLLSGRLMTHLEDLLYDELTGQGSPSEADKKLVQFFRSLLLRIKERCLTKPHQESFNMLTSRQERILKLVQESAKDHSVTTTMKRRQLEESSTARVNMAGNLRLLKSLIPLGVAPSELDTPFSPLFDDINRTTKEDVHKHWEHLKIVDPLLPGAPDILIAPFAGDGFFEWDHNTLVMPLTTDHSRGVAMVHAVANYRIMTDMLNFEGRLRQAWAEAFGHTDYKKRFVEAYHNWVLGVGLGRTHAMGSEMFHFFIDHIGPDPKKAIGPSELLKLDNDAQLTRLKECRARINAGSESFVDWRDLGVIHWRRRNLREAHDAMENAHAARVSDPTVFFSLAYLRLQQGREEGRKDLQKLVKLHPKTLWRSYADHIIDGEKL